MSCDTHLLTGVWGSRCRGSSEVLSTDWSDCDASPLVFTESEWWWSPPRESPKMGWRCSRRRRRRRKEVGATNGTPVYHYHRIHDVIDEAPWSSGRFLFFKSHISHCFIQGSLLLLYWEIKGLNRGGVWGGWGGGGGGWQRALPYSGKNWPGNCVYSHKGI